MNNRINARALTVMKGMKFEIVPLVIKSRAAISNGLIGFITPIRENGKILGIG